MILPVTYTSKIKNSLRSKSAEIINLELCSKPCSKSTGTCFRLKKKFTR
jgi:hypothetical protein